MYSSNFKQQYNMKNKIYKTLVLPVCLAMAALVSSCSMFDDYLTVMPTDKTTSETFWEDKNDLMSVVAACYVQLANSTDKMFLWGELRSDNFLLTSEDKEDIRNIMNANLLPKSNIFDWSAFYKGIGFCNLCLQKGPEIVAKDASFQEGDWKPVEAELKALRALFYFHLVRAFRDVPFVVVANETSAGAIDPVPQTASEEILTFLIKDLEGIKDYGMVNFGNDVFNKGRFTRRSIYALLADMYLWRASKNSSADSIKKYPGEAEGDYRKVIEYVDKISAEVIADFKKESVTYYGSTRSNFSKEQELPLYDINRKVTRINDGVYFTIFNENFSLEDVFEICNAYRGITNVYFGYHDGSFHSGSLSAAAAFHQISDKPDQANVAFSKTDLRAYETIMKPAGNSTNAVFNIIKGVAASVNINGTDDITNSNSSVDYEWTTTNFSYKTYRMTDLLLMKAEAIACLQEYILRADDEDMLKEGFRVAKGVFSRSNLMIKPEDDLLFENYSSSQSLEDFVMRERQRELFGEGKRWYDLVRYALRNGSTSKMLNLLVSKYSSNASAIRAKLATINSLYNPVYEDEMKVNTGLVQNPAWVTDDTSTRN